MMLFPFLEEIKTWYEVAQPFESVVVDCKKKYGKETFHFRVREHNRGTLTVFSIVCEDKDFPIMLITTEEDIKIFNTEELKTKIKELLHGRLELLRNYHQKKT